MGHDAAEQARQAHPGPVDNGKGPWRTKPETKEEQSQDPQDERKQSAMLCPPSPQEERGEKHEGFAYQTAKGAQLFFLCCLLLLVKVHADPGEKFFYTIIRVLLHGNLKSATVARFPSLNEECPQKMRNVFISHSQFPVPRFSASPGSTGLGSMRG